LHSRNTEDDIEWIAIWISQVLESLTEFSKASQKMYNDLVTFSENSEKAGNISYTEGGCNAENCSGQNGQ
jgi:hypothetical protein